MRQQTNAENAAAKKRGRKLEEAGVVLPTGRGRKRGRTQGTKPTKTEKSELLGANNARNTYYCRRGGNCTYVGARGSGTLSRPSLSL